MFVEEPIRNFVIGIVALEIGFLLYFLRRKFPKADKFVDSMTILILVFNFVGLSFPLLTEGKGYPYFFLPIFLSGAIGWLFFTQYVIVGNNNWWKDNWKNDSYRKIIHVFFYLIGGFFLLAVGLVVLIPNVPDWALP